MDAARQALHDALLAHVPADAAELRDRDAVAALVAATDRCFDRTLYEPGHITGSAFIVDAASGRVLLHHHRRLGRWLQLGGTTTASTIRSPRRCARRARSRACSTCGH